MPIFIKQEDISWYQTNEQLKIVVPISARIEKTISIQTSSKYLKVNSPPYIWECFLYSEIDNKNCYSRIDENSVTFELLKKESGNWETLSDPQSSNEAYRRKQRQAADEEIQKQIHSEIEQKSANKKEKQQAAVRNQMELENEERKWIKDQKKLENETAVIEIEELKKKSKIQNSEITREKKSKLPQDIPPPRKCGHITVTFTPRVFPTAARESQEPEEHAWLEKQIAARKTVNFDSSDLLPEEKNPDWLKQKADSMYKKGDFKSAVNAYTLALQMCPNMYSLYVGRSACHLHLNNLHKCIEDSSKALELLVPPVKSNAADRIECHKTRGEAFHKLELYVEGLMDYEAALKIDPQNESLKAAAEKIRATIQAPT